MTPGSSVQPTFVGGEISPAIYGRTDLERFTTSASELENFQPTVEGPVYRRVGTRVRNVVGSIEASEGHLLAFSSGGFSAALLFRNLSVSVIPTDSTNTADAVTIVVPYLFSQAKDIQVCQVNDVLFITHQAHPPARLARNYAGNWTYEVLPLEAGPYLDYSQLDEGVSLKISNVVDRIRLTSTYADEWKNPNIPPLNFPNEVVIEYNSSTNRSIGKLVSRVNNSNSDIIIEPLEERCFRLDKEVTAVGQYVGYGNQKGTAPYNANNAANYVPMSTSYDDGVYANNYYIIVSNGITDFTDVGAANNFVGTRFYASSSVHPLPGGGLVSNESVGFTHQFAITAEILGNYLRYIDDAGNPRWMQVKKRGDVPQQSSFGIIAMGIRLGVWSGGKITEIPSPNTGTVTQGERLITATITSSANSFTSNDVGRWLRLEFNQDIVDAKITGFTDQKTVSVKLLRGVPYSDEGTRRVLDSTTTVWKRGAFYTGNYPRCVSFFEQRLCFAATPAEPQTVWLSKVADYYNFAPTNQESLVEDDSSINITLATDVFQDIRWMTNKSTLIVGTSNAEWVITAGQGKDALTSKTVTARRESSYGSSLVQAIQSGRSVVFVQNGGIRIRELTYDYAVDAQVPLDVTVYAAHLFPGQGGAQELHYIRQPDPMLIVVTGSGQIAAMVYEPDQKVYAWSRFKLGGPGNPKVISACVSQGAGADTLWMLVLRGGRYTIEQAFPAYRPSSKEDVSTIHYFMDSATQVSVISPATTSYILTGHERFRDTTVSVLIDDQLYAAVPTSGLNITLPKAPTTRLWIGFASTARIVSYPIVPSSRVGPAPGRTLCVSKITLRVKDTLDFHYGIEGTTLQEYKVRDFSDPVTRTPYLRSDDIVLSPPRKFDTLVKWVVESRSPYPISIQMAAVEMTQTN